MNMLDQDEFKNESDLIEPKVISVGKDRGREEMLSRAKDIAEDPAKRKQMISVKTVAETYRTLDKLTLRKEYHASLAKMQVDFDFIIKNLKTLAEKGGEATRVKSLEILLKSLGMDKYDVTEIGGGGDWEETLIKQIEADEAAENSSPTASKVEDYEVFQPPTPAEITAERKRERDIGDTLIDKKFYEGITDTEAG